VREGLHAETSQLALTVILKLLISDLTTVFFFFFFLSIFSAALGLRLQHADSAVACGILFPNQGSNSDSCIGSLKS